MRPPFQERKSPMRGALDLMMGRYPRFLFGGSIGDALPVFHFHECHPAAFEPYLRYLADNAYRTVGSDEIAALVLRGVHPGPKAVAICFDDAWASLWLHVFPLLTKYNFRAITYVSPARVPEGTEPRPLPDSGADIEADRSVTRFSTWCELEAMQAGGLVDIQAHTHHHARIFCDREISGFVTPEYSEHPHDIPFAETLDGARFLDERDLGAPLYAARSRMTDTWRWIDPEAHAACTELVQEEGGTAFFKGKAWREKLLARAAQSQSGRWEVDHERRDTLRDELVRSRETLDERLGTKVRHMCFPWAIAGTVALSLCREAGYETAFSDRVGGARIVRHGDPAHQLMRLKHQLIPCLPGKGRSWFFGKRGPGASTGMRLDPVRVCGSETDRT